MTDAQLSVLLYQYSARLTRLIDAAEAELPDDVKREYMSFVDQAFKRKGQMMCPALDDLRDFAQELKHDSELLELTARGEKPQPK